MPKAQLAAVMQLTRAVPYCGQCRNACYALAFRVDEHDYAGFFFFFLQLVAMRTLVLLVGLATGGGGLT